MAYTQTQFEDSMRKTLNPSILSTYRTLADPLTTASLAAATPTKVLVTNTEEKVNDFTLDAPNTRYYLSATGVVDREFSIGFSSSVICNIGGGATVNIELYVNGVFVDNVGITRKFSNADTGTVTIVGTTTLSTGDYTEIYLTSDFAGTYTFQNTSVLLLEVN